MSTATPKRPAVLSTGLVEVEFLAFRHLFRGASIALMRWEKLRPLVAKAAHEEARGELEVFAGFLDQQAGRD